MTKQFFLDRHERSKTLFVEGKINYQTTLEIYQHSVPLLNLMDEINIDLLKISSTDSSIIALLVEWLKYASAHGKKIRFLNIPSHTQAVLALSGLKELFS